MCVLAGLILFQVAATIGYSLRLGRLAMVPIYDDVTYFVDALSRLRFFDSGGLLGLAQSLIADPPHSPFSAVLAVLGFALVPGQEWGPYLLSGVWIVFIIFLAAFVLGDLPAPTKAGVLAALLSMPVFGLIVAEFRPDPSWGLVVGFTAVLLIQTDMTESSVLRLIGVGLIAGVALLAKPSGVPGTIAVLGVAYVASVTSSLTTKRRKGLPAVLRSTLVMAAAAALIALPYLVVAGKNIVDYIRAVLVENRDIWGNQGSAWDSLLFYFRPALLLSTVGWLVLALPIALVACVLLTWRGASDIAVVAKRELCGIVAVLLTAFVVVTTNPQKTLMVGCLLYGAIIASLVWSVRHLLSGFSPRPLWAFAVGLGLFVSLWSPNRSMLRADTPEARAIDAANRALFPAVEEVIKASSPGYVPTIFVAFPGPAFAGPLEFLALQRSLKGRFVSGYVFREWHEFETGIANADVVIASESGSSGQQTTFRFPSLVFQTQVVKLLEGSRAFRPVATYADASGVRTTAFVRYMVAGARISISSGFRDSEGPYPHLKLPVVQWMVQNRAVIQIDAQETADASLLLQCRAPAPVEITLISEDSRVQQRIEPTVEFISVAFPLALKAKTTRTVELLAVASAPLPDGAPGPLLCQRPRLLDRN